jgi:hypothetical protein
MRSRRSVAWQAGVAILSSFLLAAPAAAQISFGDAAKTAEPLGLSISGGISLGSYQAGVNYGLLEVYRHAAWNPDFQRTNEIPVYRLRTVTGASAGNINTLLWAVEACTDLRTPGEVYSSPDPDASLFWQVWLDIGWDRLFDLESKELALFDRTALTEKVAGPLLDTRMRDPRLVEGCQVPAGITLTRLAPDTLRMGGLNIETQRHVTAFTVRVDSANAPAGSRVRFLQETRIRPEDRHMGVVVRLQPHDRDIPVDRLLEAVKASASFPVAFAPVILDVWYVRNGKQGPHPFVDGGAFDNNPLGLARDLYGLDEDSGSDTLDILYVNPRRYRSRLDTLRTTPGKPAPVGGLASVMALLSGAVPTARQYELQLVARERVHQAEVQQYQEAVQMLQAEVLRVTGDDRRDELMQVQAQLPRQGASERLLLSSRAYPVLGEHLSSFGAFLARPGREFDFYVGMYDGFYMTLAEHTCADSASGPARHACVGNRLDDLIRSDNVVRGPARQVLGWLYEREFGRPAGVEAPADSLREQLVVQRAFFDALGTQFAPPDVRTCKDPRLVFQLLCGDGMWTVLDSMRSTPQVVDIIERWSRNCAPRCRSERVFWRLLDDPMAGATTTVDELLQRLRDVEVDMRAQPAGSGNAYVGPVTGGEWLFYASHLRSRPLVDLIPNSVPETSWARFIPISYVGANLGTSGLEARWQPTWNVGNPGFVRGNVIAHRNGQPLRSDDHWYGGVGLMAGRYFTKVWITEIGLGANLFRAVDPEGDARTPWEIEASGVFVANQLRLSARWLPVGDDLGLLHGPQGWTVSAGLNDPVGLIYWIRSF